MWNTFKQPGFTYSACGPFTKYKERIKKIYIYVDGKYKVYLQEWSW